MKLSFSEIPDNDVHVHMMKVLHVLGELERICAYSGVSEDAIIICRTTADLLGAIKNIIDDDKKDGRLRIESAIKQLQDINLQD